MARLELLPDDRLSFDGSPVVTYGCTILNIWALEQGRQPRQRNTDITGLPVGRPEVPAIDGNPIPLAGLVVGDVDMAMPTPATHSDPTVGVRENWRDLLDVFEGQFTVESMTASWQRRTMAGGWETLTAEVQLSSWQITAAWDTEITYSVEVLPFTEWVASP